MASSRTRRSPSPNFSSPASRNSARCCRRGSPAASSASPSGIRRSAARIGAWRSIPRRSPAICAFHALAKLRGFRRKTFRYQEEQRAIEAWLRSIAQAAPLSAELAIEIAECARLIKGYGDTHKRGSGNYRLIESELMLPALAGDMPPRQAAEAIANARTAALLDPEGEALAKCLAEIESQSAPQDRRRVTLAVSVRPCVSGDMACAD